jgi:hypothetical protein
MSRFADPLPFGAELLGDGGIAAEGSERPPRRVAAEAMRARLRAAHAAAPEAFARALGAFAPEQPEGRARRAAAGVARGAGQRAAFDRCHIASASSP